MNGTAQRRKPNQRLFDRIEKRLTLSVPVYLARLNEPRSRERAVTENVSPHGARVITKHYWRSGQQAIIVSRGEFPQVGTVVYCEAKMEDRFCVGLEFPDRSLKWEGYPQT